MGVYISGIQMPEDCFSYPLKEEGFCNITNAYAGGINERNSDCPLVELPEHRGRLIDADELIDYCNDMLRIISESDDDMINIITSRICYTSVIRQIINMATVIEADRS